MPSQVRSTEPGPNEAPARDTGSRWSERAVVAGLIFVWLAATAWLRPLALPDEGRYVGVAWEMMRSGDWLTPTLNGLPFFHKPPLFYWITGASMSVLGLNEWAVRVVPAASSLRMQPWCSRSNCWASTDLFSARRMMSMSRAFHCLAAFRLCGLQRTQERDLFL